MRDSPTHIRMSPEDAVIIEAIADHMGRILDGLHIFGRTGSGWAVAEDSPIAEEQDLLARQCGPRASWTGESARYVCDASLMFLVAQADHLSVLQQVYASHSGLMFGLVPPARSILEINGYVFWLLHPEIDHIRTRASRALLSQRDNARRQRSAAKALHAPARMVSDLGAAAHDLKVRVRNEFFDYEVARTVSGDLVLRGESHPGPGRALRHLSVTGADAWNSQGVYSLLSNGAHPTLHVIADTIQPGVDGRPSRFGYPDTQFQYRLARTAMIGLLSTWQLTAFYRGLDQEPAKQLLRQIDDLPAP